MLVTMNEEIVYALGPVRVELDMLPNGEARLIVTDGITIFREWWYKSSREALDDYLQCHREGIDLRVGEPGGYYRKIIDPRKIIETS